MLMLWKWWKPLLTITATVMRMSRTHILKYELLKQEQHSYNGRIFKLKTKVRININLKTVSLHGPETRGSRVNQVSVRLNIHMIHNCDV